MKAIVYHKYGSPDVLELAGVDKPVATDDEVLVRVHASSLNPVDWHSVSGTPYVGRTQLGLLKPKSERLGVDFAGTVEAVGKDVTQFRPGDDVFGGRDGAFAEYVCVREDRAVVLKPANVTFEQAAAVPVAALTALQALRDKGQIQPGHRVLIDGASGGVGTFAVQIAKSFGAESDRRVQHEERGRGSIARRRSRHRLHPRGLHAEWTALRPDARCRGEQVVARVQARAQPAGDARHGRSTEGQPSYRAGL